MTPPLIIGITGRIGSGKTLVARHLSGRYDNAHIHRFSDILRDVMKRLHLKPTRKNFQKLGLLLRKGLGKEIIAHAMLNDIRNDRHSEVIIVDGFRYLNEVAMLRQFKNNTLIAIEAPPELRYERVVARGEEKINEHKKTFEEFLAEENKITERELPMVLKKADHVLENSGVTKEELLRNLDGLLDQISARQ